MPATAPLQGPIASAFLPAGDRMEIMRVFTTTLGDTPVYLLDIPSAFDRDTIFGDGDDDRRFILFARGVVALMLHLQEREGWHTDVVHANDWHTGLLPNYLKTVYAGTFSAVASVFTIHNLAYQGFFNPFTAYLAGLDGNGDNYVNFMARGIRYADIVSTVSPTYAQEILTPEYGEQLDGLLRTRQDHLAGIINGIDYDVFDPAQRPAYRRQLQRRRHRRQGDLQGRAPARVRLRGRPRPPAAGHGHAAGRTERVSICSTQ